MVRDLIQADVSDMGRQKEFDQSLALEQAMDVFWERGFEATSVRDLCDAMALNSGSLYGAFGDKRTLFLSALDHYVETISRETSERINGETSGLAGIRAFFNFLIGAIQSGKRRWGCLVTNSVAEAAFHDPEIAVRVKRQLKRLERSFAQALERARLDGEITAGPDAAAFLVCVVQGINIMARTGPTRKTLQQVVDVALAGIGAR